MTDLKDMTLEQMNLELTIAQLLDCEKYLKECLDNLEKALNNSRELKDYFKGEK